MSFSARTVRFGPFELDLRAAELRQHNGTKTKLPEQPFQILCELVEHPGEVVTREELRQRLWRSDTFVDFEHGLNTAVKRLRELLGDSAENPRYIETLPRHGYRLMVQVERPEPASIVIPKTARRRSVRLVFSALLVLAIAAGLGWWLLGHFHTVKVESLAVLPLENLSGKPEEDYFADSMTQALITELGKVRALRVISWQSMRQYKGTNKSVPQIARELHVDAVVEGSAIKASDKVRITAQVIHADPERHLWSESYERDLRDVLALQREVARTIVNEIKAKVTPQEQTLLANARPVNPEAYELYLKGRYEWNKRTGEGLKKGLEYFQRSINLDPTYALAYSGVADSYQVLGDNGFLPGTEVFPKAKAAALKALELDKTSTEAHLSLADLLEEYDHDYVASLKEFETAIELNPNHANAHHWYALMLASLGRSEEAVREIEQARRLDPLSVRINANVVYVLYLARQYDRAIVEARKAMELEPDDWSARNWLGLTYLQKGMRGEALAELQKRLTLQPTHPIASADLAFAHAAAGNREEALNIVGKLKERSKREYVSPYAMGRAYVGLGEKEEALAWLGKGVGVYDGQMMSLKMDPALDPLRSEPRFQELLQRMNFPP